MAVQARAKAARHSGEQQVGSGAIPIAGVGAKAPPNIVRPKLFGNLPCTAMVPRPKCPPMPWRPPPSPGTFPSVVAFKAKVTTYDVKRKADNQNLGPPVKLLKTYTQVAKPIVVAQEASVPGLPKQAAAPATPPAAAPRGIRGRKLHP